MMISCGKLKAPGSIGLRYADNVAAALYPEKPQWMQEYVTLVRIRGYDYGIAVDPAGGAWACRGVPVYGPVFCDSVLSEEHDKRYAVAIQSALSDCSIRNKRCKNMYPNQYEARDYGSVKSRRNT